MRLLPPRLPLSVSPHSLTLVLFTMALLTSSSPSSLPATAALSKDASNPTIDVDVDDGIPPGMTDEEFHAFNAGRTVSVGYLVYPGFTPLDVFGPFDFLQRVSNDVPLTLSTISKTAGPVSSTPPGKAFGWPVVATHGVADAPPLDLLMVPGGASLGNETWMPDFIAARFADTRVVASVCSGANTLALAGVLDGRRATTNKRGWKDFTGEGTNVTWVPSARYVRDGKVWTSSGVAAGMDMTYALLKWMYGSEKIDVHFNNAEYAPHVDPHWDPYSEVFKVPGANYTGSFKDLVGPLGYE